MVDPLRLCCFAATLLVLASAHLEEGADEASLLQHPLPRPPAEMLKILLEEPHSSPGAVAAAAEPSPQSLTWAGEFQDSAADLPLSADSRRRRRRCLHIDWSMALAPPGPLVGDRGAFVFLAALPGVAGQNDAVTDAGEARQLSFLQRSAEVFSEGQDAVAESEGGTSGAASSDAPGTDFAQPVEESPWGFSKDLETYAAHLLTTTTQASQQPDAAAASSNFPAAPLASGLASPEAAVADQGSEDEAPSAAAVVLDEARIASEAAAVLRASVAESELTTTTTAHSAVAAVGNASATLLEVAVRLDGGTVGGTAERPTPAASPAAAGESASAAATASTAHVAVPEASSEGKVIFVISRSALHWLVGLAALALLAFWLPAALAGRRGGMELCSFVRQIPLATAEEIRKLAAGGGGDGAGGPDLSGTLLRVEGRIRGLSDGFLVAPFSGRKCAMYSASVSRSRLDSVHGPPLAYHAARKDFMLEVAGAGGWRLMVEGGDVELFGMTEGSYVHELVFSAAPHSHRSFVVSHLLPSKEASMHFGACADLSSDGACLEFRECALLEGAMVTCVGELVRDRHGGSALRPFRPQPGEARARSKAWKALVGHVVVTDDPGLLGASR